MKKRILSFLLAVLMVIGSVPLMVLSVSADAGTETESATFTEEDYLALYPKYDHIAIWVDFAQLEDSAGILSSLSGRNLSTDKLSTDEKAAVQALFDAATIVGGKQQLQLYDSKNITNFTLALGNVVGTGDDALAGTNAYNGYLRIPGNLGGGATLFTVTGTPANLLSGGGAYTAQVGLTMGSVTANANQNMAFGGFRNTLDCRNGELRLVINDAQRPRENQKFKINSDIVLDETHTISAATYYYLDTNAYPGSLVVKNADGTYTIPKSPITFSSSSYKGAALDLTFIAGNWKAGQYMFLADRYKATTGGDWNEDKWAAKSKGDGNTLSGINLYYQNLAIYDCANGKMTTEAYIAQADALAAYRADPNADTLAALEATRSPSQISQDNRMLPTIDYKIMLDSSVVYAAEGAAHGHEANGQFTDTRFNAKLYYYRVYDCALTEAELAQLHFADLARRFRFDLTNYYTLSDAQRSELYNTMRTYTLSDTPAAVTNAYNNAVADILFYNALYDTDGMIAFFDGAALYEGAALPTVDRFGNKITVTGTARDGYLDGTVQYSGILAGEDGFNRSTWAVNAVLKDTAAGTGNRVFLYSAFGEYQTEDTAGNARFNYAGWRPGFNTLGMYGVINDSLYTATIGADTTTSSVFDFTESADYIVPVTVVRYIVAGTESNEYPNYEWRDAAGNVYATATYTGTKYEYDYYKNVTLTDANGVERTINISKLPQYDTIFAVTATEIKSEVQLQLTARPDGITKNIYHNGFFSASVWTNTTRNDDFSSTYPFVYAKSNTPGNNNGSDVTLGATSFRVYALRIYNRSVTTDTITRNHFADICRHFGLDMTDFLQLTEEQRATVYPLFDAYTIESDVTAAALQEMLDIDVSLIHAEELIAADKADYDALLAEAEALMASAPAESDVLGMVRHIRDLTALRTELTGNYYTPFTEYATALQKDTTGDPAVAAVLAEYNAFKARYDAIAAYDLDALQTAVDAYRGSPAYKRVLYAANNALIFRLDPAAGRGYDAAGNEVPYTTAQTSGGNFTFFTNYSAPAAKDGSLILGPTDYIKVAGLLEGVDNATLQMVYSYLDDGASTLTVDPDDKTAPGSAFLYAFGQTLTSNTAVQNALAVIDNAESTSDERLAAYKTLNSNFVGQNRTQLFSFGSHIWQYEYHLLSGKKFPLSQSFLAWRDGDGPFRVFVNSALDARYPFFSEYDEAYTLTLSSARGEASGSGYAMTRALYVNGGVVSLGGKETELTPTQTLASDLVIGQNVAARLYEVRVYNRVLTAEEVAQNNFADIAIRLNLDVDNILSMIVKGGSDELLQAVYDAFVPYSFDTITAAEAQALISRVLYRDRINALYVQGMNVEVNAFGVTENGTAYSSIANMTAGLGDNLIWNLGQGVTTRLNDAAPNNPYINSQDFWYRQYSTVYGGVTLNPNIQQLIPGNGAIFLNDRTDISFLAALPELYNAAAGSAVNYTVEAVYSYVDTGLTQWGDWFYNNESFDANGDLLDEGGNRLSYGVLQSKTAANGTFTAVQVGTPLALATDEDIADGTLYVTKDGKNLRLFTDDDYAKVKDPKIGTLLKNYKADRSAGGAGTATRANDYHKNPLLGDYIYNNFRRGSFFYVGFLTMQQHMPRQSGTYNYLDYAASGSMFRPSSGNSIGKQEYANGLWTINKYGEIISSTQMNMATVKADTQNTGTFSHIFYENANVYRPATNMSFTVKKSVDDVRIGEQQATELYAVRVYGRALTDAERYRNHFADLLNYYGITLALLDGDLLDAAIRLDSEAFDRAAAACRDVWLEKDSAAQEAAVAAIEEAIITAANPVTFDGFQVRLTSDVPGLRSLFTVDFAIIAALEARGYTVEIGTMMAAASRLSGIDAMTVSYDDATGSYVAAAGVLSRVAYRTGSTDATFYEKWNIYNDTTSLAYTTLMQSATTDLATMAQTDVMYRVYVSVTDSKNETHISYVDGVGETVATDGKINLYTLCKKLTAVAPEYGYNKHVSAVIAAVEGE